MSPGDDYGSATWTGINSFVNGINNETISNSWIAQNIQQGHGPLGAAYPDVAWGVEGDTPSFLSLIPNGLNDAGASGMGRLGWSLRIVQAGFFQDQRKEDLDVPIAPETREIWTNADDSYTPYIPMNMDGQSKRTLLSFTGYKVSLVALAG